MKDENKTKDQLLKELNELHNQIKEFKKFEITRHGIEKELRQSEEKLQRIFESVNDGITVTDLDGNIVDINEKILELGGYSSKSNLIGKNAIESIADYDRERALDNMAELLQQREVGTGEFNLVRADGSEYPTEINANVLMDNNNNPMGFVSVIRDITERKLNEVALRKSEENFRELAENANDGILITTGVGVFVFANKRASEITGYSVKELFNTNIKKLAHPDEFKKLDKLYKKRLAGKKVATIYETILIRKDKKQIPVEITAATTSWQGQPADLAIIRDITERKRPEEAQKRSSVEWETTFNTTSDLIMLVDKDFKIIRANSATAKFLKLKPERLIGKTCFKLMHGTKKPPANCPFMLIHRSKKHEEKEFYISNKRKWIHASVDPIFNEDGEITNIVHVVRDITEQKLFNEVLKESEEKYRNIFESVNDVIIYVSKYGKILNVNQQVENLFGYKKEEVIGKNFMKLRALKFKDLPKLIKLFKHSANVGAVQDNKGTGINFMELQINRKDGKKALVETNTSVIKRNGKTEGFLTIIRDITNRKKAEEKEKQNIEDLKYLSETALGYVDLKPNDDIYKYIAEHLKKLVDDSIVIINSFDPKTDLTRVQVVEGFGKLTKSAFKIFGRNPIGSTYKINEIAKRQLLLGNYHKVPGKLFTLSFGQIPKPVCYALEKLFKIREIHSMGFTWQGKLLGDVIIILRKNTKLKNKKVIEAFINQTAVALQRKQAEEELRESEERFRGFAEKSFDIIFMMGIDGTITYASPAIEKLLGYKPDEVKGRLFSDFTPDWEILKAKQIINKLSIGEAFEGIELEINGKNGKIQFIEINATPILKNGNIIGFQGIVREITERKRAEEEIKKRLMKFRLEEGKLYLVKEISPTVSIEAVKDLVKVGYRGIVLSRTSIKDLKLHAEVGLKCLWFSDKKGKDTISPDLKKIERLVETLPKKNLVLIERLDYLISKHGFKKVLAFVQHLNELAVITNNVFIISLDPSILKEQELKLLEKDALDVKPSKISILPEHLMEIMKFIYQQNSVGIKPSHREISKEFRLSKPTTRKRINQLIYGGYVLENIKGRQKVVELTGEGKTIFA